MEQDLIHKIIRSRRRTVGLQVTPDALLIVRVPERMSLGTIHEMIRKKLPWIQEKQRFAREHYLPAAKKAFTGGEKFLYLGEEFNLFLTPGAYGPLVHKEEGFFLPKGCVPLAECLFRDWYREQATALLDARVRHYAGVTGLRYSRIGISNAQSRWGSCSSRGVLNFSWKLVMAPRDVVDYVVVHEVVHLEELNHSKRFWQKVKTLAPHYLQAKRWLEIHRRKLDF